MTSLVSLLLVAVSTALLCAPASAQDPFPAAGKAIHLVVPYTAGGPTDLVARALARQMEGALGTPVVVENKAGAQGAIAMQGVARARPDGYTVAVVPGSALTSNLVLVKELQYKPEDFRLLTPLYRGAIALTVPATSPARSLREFTEQAKRLGRPLIFGGAGRGSVSHLAMEQWAAAAGVTLQMVTYRGDTQVVADLIGNNVPSMISALGPVLEHYKAGKLRVLAVSTATRLPAFPEIPTFAESGFPEIVSYFWAGTAVPAGTPDHIADKLRTAITQAMNTREVGSALSADMVPYTTNESEFKRFVQGDFDKLRSIITSAKVTLE